MQKKVEVVRKTDLVILVSSKYKKRNHADDLALKFALSEKGYIVEIAAWDDTIYDFGKSKLAIIRSCWDYDKRVDEFLERMRLISKQCILLNSFDMITKNSNKRYLSDIELKGITIVPAQFIDDIKQLDKAIEQFDTDKLIIKPVTSASGRDTYCVERKNGRLINKRVKGILIEKSVMIQPYIQTIETKGEKSTVVIDGEPLFTMLKKPAKKNFLVHEHYGGTYIEDDMTFEEKVFVKGVVATFNEPPLYMRIDYLFTETGTPMLLELELIEPNLYLSKNKLVLEKITEKLVKIILGY